MRKLAFLPAVIAATVALPAMSSQAATLEELEERVKKLEKNDKRAKYRMRSLRNQLSEAEEQFRTNGFFQAGFSTLDTPEGEGNMMAQNFDGEIDDRVRAEAETLVGLQFAAKVNEKTELVTQIVGRGGNDFDAGVEWAFLKHQLTDDITVRAGRLRTPFFALSEYLEVAYAMPWVRAPQEVYGSSISSYTGFDLLYRTRVGGVNLGAQLFYGSDDSNNDNVRVELEHLHGLRLSGDYRGFNASVGFTVAQHTNVSGFEGEELLVSGPTAAGAGLAQVAAAIDGLVQATGTSLPSYTYVGEPIAEEDGRADFLSFALGYTNGPLDLKAEHIRQRVRGVFQDEEANYFSAAYRIGEFTPYAYYARLYTIDDDDRKATVDQLAAWEGSITDLRNVIAFGESNGFLTAQEAAQLNGALDLVQDGPNGNDGLVALRAGLTPIINGFTGEQTSYAVGLRWDFMPNLALKAEVQQFKDVINSPRFEPGQGQGPRGDMELYTISINGVF